MTAEIFAVHDAAADRFIDPFPAPTVEFAIRGFRQAAEDEGHQFNKFPEDYALFHIGSFDAELGTLEAFTPRKVSMASNFRHGRQIDLETEAGR